MNILIGADFVPTESNTAYFVRGDAQHLFGEELQKLLAAADYRIFNLETPLADTATPIPKCGPNLIASTGAVAGYRAAGADLLTLANNHILDQGEAGLRTTVETLERAGIAHIGTGDTPHAAAEPYIFTCSGRKIGVKMMMLTAESITMPIKMRNNRIRNIKTYLLSERLISASPILVGIPL